MVEDFLISEGATHLLDQRKKPLSETARRELICLLHEYIVLKFGAYPTSDQKESVASSIVFLFPSLKSTRDKKGTVSSEGGQHEIRISYSCM